MYNSILPTEKVTPPLRLTYFFKLSVKMYWYGGVVILYHMAYTTFSFRSFASAANIIIRLWLPMSCRAMLCKINISKRFLYMLNRKLISNCMQLQRYLGPSYIYIYIYIYTTQACIY